MNHLNIPRPSSLLLLKTIFNIYLEIARKKSLGITHVFETPIHADFMNGAQELFDRLAGSARLFVSGAGNASFEFEHQWVRHKDVSAPCHDYWLCGRHGEPKKQLTWKNM